MTEATICATADAANLIAELKAAALAPLKIEGSHHLVLPERYRHADITKLVEASQPNPNRKAGTVALGGLQSLLDYCEDQAAQAGAYVFADPDRRTITVVFNDHRADAAGWRDHRAQFSAVFTPEFTTWLNNDGSNKAKSQGEFAEFIEDNLADITEPAAQQLLEVATTIQAKTDINFSSAKRLDNGQVQLGYTETIDARAGAGGALSIP
jgi:uncharacterized protein YfdQ (DUF2303 family)